MGRYYFDCTDYQNDMARTLVACFNHVVSLIAAGLVYLALPLLAIAGVILLVRKAAEAV